MKILLVEADRQFADRLQAALVQQHYLVDLALDGETGWQLADTFTYDLLLLDLAAPSLDGLRFCQQRRHQGDRTPILLLASQDNNINKVASLDAGADDYLSKPIDPEELLAHIRALLRRGQAPSLPELVWGDLRLEPPSCQVTYAGQLLKLTAKEYELLELFLRYPQRIFSQSVLLDRLWSFEDAPTENAVRTQIKSLRAKLKRAGAEDPLETIYGLGYRLREQPPEPEPPSTPVAIAQAQLADLWERQKPHYLERLEVIAQAAAALQTGPLPAALQAAARHEAHTLAGSLGSFGLKAASAAAQGLETCLAQDPPEALGLLALLGGLRQALRLGQVPGQPASGPTPGRPRSFLLDGDDAALAAAVALEAEQWRWQVQMVHSLAAAQQALAHQQPDALLLDLGFPESADAGFQLLATVTKSYPQLPVIVFTAKEALLDRVKVARLGGVGFLQKPIAPGQVLRAIAQVLDPPPPPEAQVLAVSGDRPLLAHLETLLTPWGLQVTGLDQPADFWPSLAAQRPDLLLLDLELPEFSGPELCAVVRNEPQWCHLPILLLVERGGSTDLGSLFAAGADDYVGKPLIAPELLARTLNRLEHQKLWQRRLPVSL